MIPLRRLLLLLLLVQLSQATPMPDNDNMMSMPFNTSEVKTYWHNWADAQGVTHLTECTMRNFSRIDLLPPNPPVYIDYVDQGGKGPSKVFFLNTPVGWSGAWHKDPVPQLVITLAGEGVWTTMDGSNVTLTPGSVYLGNDQASSRGHHSMNTGKGLLQLLLIQYPQWPTKLYRPCWLP